MSVDPRRGIRACAALAMLLALVVSRPAAAQERTCSGPPECCVAARAPAMATPQEVALGVVMMGMHNVTERSGTWDADFYLYEAWAAAPGFTPDTEIVNEVNRISEQFDSISLTDGRCLRTRRIRSTLYSNLNLRRFPFDRQTLLLRISDDSYDSTSVRYSARAHAVGIDDDAREQLSSWMLDGELAYTHQLRLFRWDAGAAPYDYASFTVPIRRHVTFHLARFFLPLLIILGVSFTVFWIDPEDLQSQVGIGVTCLLAAIAFQYTEASSLPEVGYVTLADRVYACCYPAIALSMVQSIYLNHLVRKDRRELARRLDKISRWAFPLATLAAVTLAVVTAMRR